MITHFNRNPNLQASYWHNLQYKTKDEMVLLSNKLIAEVIKLFWNEVMNKLNNDTKVMILFRIKWSNGNI